MNGHEFLRLLKRYADREGLNLVFDPAHGKGSHGTVRIGKRFTRLKDRKKEIGKGLLSSMCRDLGIDREDLR